ncbi:uncharacterized protein BDR25DRAFT_333266 [Lindgomyces ingoldianus]|uniref:Uncharacterized protein n=1 Tax=Lindgomyces ingoldianus TaxID=673940 RepID=A0ACB6QZC2_9PLEO|nr:uncharacterized protein BDR25DRAFT_333266 [Lindgomyces ingoldianus]KAF2472383.1 hypothetical protein BDR25DRAFT_333266 [Lindgomyces ingoldianus]
MTSTSRIALPVQMLRSAQTQYDSIHHSVKHQNIASQLTAFLSSSFSKRLKVSIRITADQAKTYYLNHAGQWFREAVKSRETHQWIERTIDQGEDIYVIVAYHTLTKRCGGALGVLVLTALTASGVVILFANAVDPALGGFCGRIEEEQGQLIAPGEQIYAVQYRRVSWRWFARNKVDEPEDMIEVELEDEITLDRDHDECALESGETFVSIA